MTTNVAALNISVSANTATLQSDFSRAAEIARRGGNDMKASMLEAANAAQHGFASAAQSMGLLNNPISRAVQGFGAVGLALGAVAGGGFVFGELVRKAIDMGASMADLSIKTGLSVEMISRFTTIAKLSGTEIDTVAQLMKKLNISAVEAYSGNSKLLGIFNAIGISAKELKALSPDDLMARFAQAIQGLDPKVVDDVMKQLGGKGAAEAKVFLKELVERLDETHAKISTTFASDAKIFNDNLILMGDGVKYLGVQVASKLLPELNLAIQAFRDASKEGKGFLSSIGAAFKTNNLLMGVDIRNASEELTKAQGQLADLNKAHPDLGSKKNSFFSYDDNVALKKTLEDRIALLQQYKVSNKAVLADALDAPKNNAASSALAKTNPEGDNFIQGLQNLITKADQGRYALLTLEAAQKKVSAAAAPLIAALQKADESRSVKLYENTLQRQNDDIAFQITLVGKSTREVEILNVEHKNTLELQKQIEAIEKQSGVISAAARAQMTSDTKAANDYQVTAIRKRQDAERSWGFGSTQALRNYIDENENAADQSARLWNNGFSSMEDGMVSFCTSGQLNFSNLANGIISDIIRIQARMMIAGLASSIMGGLTTGTSAGGFGLNTAPSSGFGINPTSTRTFGSLSAKGNAFSVGNVIPFARGGVVSRPTIFPMANGAAGLMGEAGAEAVMPLTRDSNGKLGVQSLGTSGGGSTVNITVNNEAGGDGYVAVASAKKNDTGLDIELIVRKAMAADLRSNGQISQQMSNTFGLRRSG